jgi:hypothetical protein
MMKKFLVFVLALMVLASAAILAEKPSTTIALINAPMKVDGSAAKWKKAGIAPIAIDRASQVAIGNIYWLKAEKESALIYVAFSPKGINLTAVVKSPKGLKNNNVDGNIYNGNGIELFIGFDNSDPSRQLYTETDYQIGFSTGDYSKANGKYETKPSIWCYNLQKPVEGAKIVTKAEKGGYILDAFVPAEFLPGYDVRDGAEIGFDVGVDEVGDKGMLRKIQMTWSGDKDGWKVPSGWGKATIKK